MTYATKKNLTEYLFLGDLILEVMENFADALRQGKIDEGKIIRADIDWNDEYGWAMRVICK